MNGNLQEKYNKLLNILRSTGGLATKLSAARSGGRCKNTCAIRR